MTSGYRTAVLLAFAALAAAAGPGCGDDGDTGGPAPVIESVAPAEAAAGATVELVGRRYCGPAADDVGEGDACTAPPNGFVTFGLASDAGPAAEVARARIVSWKSRRIEVEVPASLAAGVTGIVVTVNGLASNQHDFTVLE